MQALVRLRDLGWTIPPWTPETGTDWSLQLGLLIPPAIRPFASRIPQLYLQVRSIPQLASQILHGIPPHAHRRHHPLLFLLIYSSFFPLGRSLDSLKCNNLRPSLLVLESIAIVLWAVSRLKFSVSAGLTILENSS